MVIALTDGEEDIKEVATLLEKHPALNVPTTLAISDGYIYIIANSQMDNLVQLTNKIIDSKILTDSYILKIKLKL
jgi:hypothetical protein